ncbi:hypothetical protein [Caminibacter sp.]
MKILRNALVAGLLLASVGTTAVFADYNKGFKYYKRFITHKAHIKATKFVKILGVQTPAQLEALFKDDAKPLIQILEKKGYKKAAKIIETKFAKNKRRLKDLEDFLVGIVEGKIPAG